MQHCGFFGWARQARGVWARVALVALASLVAGPRASQAMGGMGLRWGSCEGYSNRNFACSPNSGSEMLVASVSPPTGVGQMSGIAVVGRITSSDGAVPPWWDLVNRGACRSSSLSAAFDVGDQTECDDPWLGQAMGGFAYYRSDSRGAEFEVAVAVPSSAVQSVSAGRTYAVCKLFVNHQRSGGPGSCNGCDTPMCISLESMTIAAGATEPGDELHPAHEVVLTNGIPAMGGMANIVTWQGGTAQCGEGAPKPSTWTEVKRHYH